MQSGNFYIFSYNAQVMKKVTSYIPAIKWRGKISYVISCAFFRKDNSIMSMFCDNIWIDILQYAKTYKPFFCYLERENAVCFYMNCFIFEAECVFNFEFVRTVEL